MPERTPKQEALDRLDLRLAAGEIDEPTYDRLKTRILSSTPTPIPDGKRSPQPLSSPNALPGPSGGRGDGVRTEIDQPAELGIKPGTVLLGQWRIVRELGRGGFGAVFEAEELNLGQTQALKVLDPAMVAREELLARFRREVALMRALVHPRIVRVYDYREEMAQGLALISMEYVAGCAVREVLAAARKKKMTIPVGLALAILDQVLESLAAAHAQGVIHRDVTPGNILLAGGTAEELLAAWGDEAAGGTGAPAAGSREVPLDPQVKLVDFGIAGLVERTELSQKSRVMGTTGYVAPEALDADAEVTAAADVFGAGAVAYELLCGKVPLSTGFKDIAALRAEIPGELAALVNRLVRAEAKARPSAAAGQAELAAVHKRLVAAQRQQAEETERQRQAEADRQRREAETKQRAEAERQRTTQRRTELVDQVRGLVAKGRLGPAEEALAALAKHLGEKTVADKEYRKLKKALVEAQTGKERSKLVKRVEKALTGGKLTAAEEALAELAKLLGKAAAQDEAYTKLTKARSALVVEEKRKEKVKAASRSGLVACPLDGKRNRPEETFRCRGCGQEDLCLTHLDPEERICVECVTRRQTDEERQRQEELIRQREQAEAAYIDQCQAYCKNQGVRLLQPGDRWYHEPPAAEQQAEARRLGQPVTFQEPATGMAFVLIPPGQFMMGSNNGGSDEKPVHGVTLTKAFYLQTTEVTQGQWQAVMGDNPSKFKSGDDYPVETVSWNDVQAFLEKLNAMDPGKNYRLPTEAEWEYACRAGTTGERHGELDAIAWYNENSGGRTHPVGQKQPNAWGLYDMLGNVWDWCTDWYGENYYANSPVTDPRGPSSGSCRVVRGGSWYFYDFNSRSAYRGRFVPDSRVSGYVYGFRCVRD